HLVLLLSRRTFTQNPGHPPPLEQLGEGIELPDAEIRSGGTPAPRRVITNLWSVEKPETLHRRSVGKPKSKNRLRYLCSGTTIRRRGAEENQKERRPLRWNAARLPCGFEGAEN